MRGRDVAAGLALGAAVVWLAWPLPAHLGSHLVDAGPAGDRIDLDLLVWILAWDAHAVVTQPTRLFQANIFHPAPDVLASSEHLLGLLPIAGPAFLATGNAVLTYNVTILATVLIGALATWLLVRAWTERAAAGLVAAAAFALSPALVLSWTRLHATAVHLFPLVLLLATRAATAPTRGRLLVLALAIALQAAAGVHLALELGALLVAFAPALWWEARRHGRSPLPVLGAAAAGALVLVPLALPYVRARAAGTLPAFAAAHLPAVGFDWVAAQVVSALSWPVVCLGLAGIVIARRVAWHLRLGLAAVAALGTLLSMGPGVPLLPGTQLPGVYDVALALVPGFATVRAPMRFIVLPYLALAVLGGLAVDSLMRALARVGGRAGAGAAGLAALAGTVALVVGRAPAAPVPLAAASPGATDRWLAAHGDGRPVLELPAWVSTLEGAALRATGDYMRGSTLHWSPLVNGYSGWTPPSYPLLATLAGRLPDAGAWRDVCALVELAWLVVHRDLLPASSAAAWTAAAPGLDLEPAFTTDTATIYRVRGRCGALSPALAAALASPAEADAGVTLAGVSRAPLAAAARRGRIEGTIPAALATGLFTTLRVRVTNESTTTWPGLSVRPAGRVVLQVRWHAATGGALVAESRPTLLATDLAPGASVDVAVGTIVPPEGDYRVEVGLAQEGAGWFADDPGGSGRLAAPVRAVGRQPAARITGWRRPTARTPSTARCAGPAACARS